MNKEPAGIPTPRSPVPKG